MSSYSIEEILPIRPKDGDDRDAGDDYVPVLYRPDLTNVIPSAVKYLYDLAPKSSTERSRQISQRNIAVLGLLNCAPFLCQLTQPLDSFISLHNLVLTPSANLTPKESSNATGIALVIGHL